jgi:NADH-quinone oxidoreductase subunit L
MKAELLFLIPLLPLVGAVTVLFGGGRLPRRTVAGLASATVAASAGTTLALWPLAATGTRVTLFTWLAGDGPRVPVEILFSPMAAAMALMVTGVGTLIHLYAAAYLHDEPDYRRFFCLFNLFAFAMLLIVLADNLLLLFVGWEGVGLCSYALIGFWYRNPAFASAGRKAFLMTRGADVLFGIALLWLFRLSGTLSISAINAQAAAWPTATVTLLALLLLAGACGKSAQLPFCSWLPDAMAGPTPVSALIHAATMVTAGVYLLCRLFPLISQSPVAPAVIGLIGAATAFYGASCALVQRDIKRLLAYSTISQVGYMFLAVGAGAVTGAMFHLLTHAFFKALLFMAAGCVIHLAGGEQDLFRLGGLYRRAPAVFWPLLAGALALAGVPLTSGFFSKDAILAACFAHGTPGWTLLGVWGLFSALLTALYALRLVYLTGPEQPEMKVAGRISPAMPRTLLPLALLALIAGQINLPATWGGSSALQRWLQTPAGPIPSHRCEWLLAGLTLLLILAAWQWCRRRYQPRPVAVENALSRFLQAGWRLDDLFHRLLVIPYGWLAGQLAERVERPLNDSGPHALGRACLYSGQRLRAAATGCVGHYLIAMAAGLLLLLAGLLTALLP